MAYDLDKYRVKREKVLGVRKRGAGPMVAAGLVAVLLVAVIGGVLIPRAVAYLGSRNLDDAIYKITPAGSRRWRPEVMAALEGLAGVRRVVLDHGSVRLVVTFDRRRLDTARITKTLARFGVAADLLNRVGHRERMMILEKEAEFEAL